MKKQEAISKVKDGSHAIHMNRKEPKYIDLLREILKEAFPNDVSPSGLVNFYHVGSVFYKWDSSNQYDDPTIKITEITEEENYTTHQTCGSSNVFTSKKNVFETKKEETFESSE